MTPLGLPVEPDVNMISPTCCGLGSTKGTGVARPTAQTWAKLTTLGAARTRREEERGKYG